MLGALGVNQSVLFTAVFALGSVLAGLGGALQVAREPANLGMDLTVITDAFVVVVIGGMGSIVGSYVAAVLIAEVKALCIGIGLVSLGGFSVNFSKLTLVAEFLVMAVVLIARPQGLLGRPQLAARGGAEPEAPLRPASRALSLFGLARLSGAGGACRCWRAPRPTRSSSALMCLSRCCSRPACISSWGRAGCTLSATRPISGSAPMAPRLVSNGSRRRHGACAAARRRRRRRARSCSAGSPCGSPASISRC